MGEQLDSAALSGDGLERLRGRTQPVADPIAVDHHVVRCTGGDGPLEAVNHKGPFCGLGGCLYWARRRTADGRPQTSDYRPAACSLPPAN